MPEKSAWRPVITNGMIGCDSCKKAIRRFADKKFPDGKIVISELSKEDRTYYKKGSRKLCKICYENLNNNGGTQ
ncbi:hypothetical protein D3C74_49960 [compost metagenome]